MTSVTDVRQVTVVTGGAKSMIQYQRRQVLVILGSGRSSIIESRLADEVDGVRPRRGRHGRPGGLPDWATWRLLDGIKEIASASAAPDVVGGSASKST